jgi:hypothetical protein
MDSAILFHTYYARVLVLGLWQAGIEGLPLPLNVLCYGILNVLGGILPLSDAGGNVVQSPGRTAVIRRRSDFVPCAITSPPHETAATWGDRGREVDGQTR